MNKKNKIRPRKIATQDRAKFTIGSIVEAASQIIEKSGIEKLSTNQIAKKAGVSIGSLYQYFPSKESILAVLVESELTAHFKEVKRQIEFSEKQNLEEFAEEILDLVFDMFEEKKKVRYLLFKFIPRGLTPIIHQVEDEMQEVLTQKLKTFKELEGRENLDIMSYVIIHSIFGIVHGYLPKSRKIHRELVEAELKKIFKLYLQNS